MTGSPNIEIPKERIADFCHRWKVAELSLFGSVLRDDFSPASDVDVLVQFIPGSTVTIGTMVTMKEELESLFRRKVDILTKKAVQASKNPLRKKAILGGAQIVYSS